MNLNEDQKKVVEHYEGPLVVVAAPGSGKSTCLVERAAHLIQNKNVNPNKILNITFTNKAANEMRKRLSNRIDIKKMYAGTFHAFCALLLRRYGEKIGIQSNFNIIDDKEQKDIFKKILKVRGIGSTEKKKRNSDNSLVSHLAQVLNNKRESLEDDNYVLDYLKDKLEGKGYNVQELFECCEEYLDITESQGLIDFSGLLYRTIDLLDSGIDKVISKKFDFIQIDEVQDTNYAQFQIIKLLMNSDKNCVLVGDVDQSIYGWRQARYENLIDFHNEFKARLLSLPKNYRSTKNIIKVANKLIKYNQDRLNEKDCYTDNSDGLSVLVNKYLHQYKESEDVCEKIKNYKYAGYNYGDIAILYRSNRIGNLFENDFVKNGIPYNIFGAKSLYDKSEIRDCISMLKFFSNRYDSVAFSRVFNLLPWVGDATILKIEQNSMLNDIDIVEACKLQKVPAKAQKAKESFLRAFDEDILAKPGEVLESIVDKLGYDFLCEELYPDDYGERLENVEDFIRFCKGYDSQNVIVDEFLNNILLASDEKNIEDGKVSLMSIHASKGLEFPIVFVSGVEVGIMPNNMCFIGIEDPEILQRNEEEERRLLFVAITRAEKELNLNYCLNRIQPKRGNKNGPEVKPTGPSKFLIECGFDVD